MTQYTEYNKAYKRKKTKEFNLKWRNVICSKCGADNNTYNKPINFHHVNPDSKLFNIRRAECSGMSDEMIQSEIDKCIPLCHVCHRKEHDYNRGSGKYGIAKILKNGKINPVYTKLMHENAKRKKMEAM